MNTNYPSYKPASFKGLIGVSRADITPPDGIYSRNWGAAKHDVAKGIHRPLILTCITFQSSPQEKPLVLMGADLGWWRNMDDELLFRTKLVAALGIEFEHLMFCLSHTHAGPVLSREESSKPGGEYILSYLDELFHIAVNTCTNAIASAVPSILTWHSGTCSLAANRDLPDAAHNRFVVGFNAEAPADNTLLVGRITDAQNRITGVIINYACHPTTLAWENHFISPDYIGAMREVVESKTQAPCLFLQGASGELSPAEQYTGDTTVADKHGRQLGYAVMATLEEMLTAGKELSFSGVVESGAPLAVWKQTTIQPADKIVAQMISIRFNLKPLPSLAEIEQQIKDCEDRVMKERLVRKRSIRKALGDGHTAQIPLWIWRLGDSFLIGQPNEAYSQFQKELRRKLSPKAVAVMNLVNGSMGYLPPLDCYDKDIYQEWQSPFASGSLEQLITVAKNVAEEINSSD